MSTVLSLILLVILFVIIAIKMISSTKRDVSHPRLKSETWWLNRKNQARTSINLDRNNLTKSTRNLASGYLITNAINRF